MQNVTKRSKILGISLGSSTRDHKADIQIGDTLFSLERKGTNGSINEAVDLIRANDRHVDAFGLGGAVMFLNVNSKTYFFNDLKQIERSVTHSKICDGNLVKGILNENALQAIEAKGIKLKGLKTLHMGAIDRYSQAKLLYEKDCDIIFGDIIFGIGLPIPIRKLKTINIISAILLPVITKMPFRWFYPIGKKQDKKPVKKFTKYFKESELIVGDFIWIKVNLPDDLRDKIILTNTTTEEDVKELKKRGLKLLITTTPRINGRTFGTNIIEAMLLSMVSESNESVSDKELRKLINEIPIKPNIEILKI